ncbi:hypothetical protein LOK49_LG09G01858 [Camellia lanceoleosa]|uniref:Uncharacterized protein n=1 Tax=Camellia lanceoleosa TaxID=1840588 RepID=A0ACC0GMJ2_9ERIC|nr:hypothetical protein LOK49_LG09G01858 [Camellia lanceoleosa]
MSETRVKKVVDIAFKTRKSIDWDGMAKLLVSNEARKEFVNLRRAFDEVNSILQTKFNQISTNAREVSVLMPGENIPTFIAHPAPMPCSPEHISWPTHQHTSLLDISQDSNSSSSSI